MKISIDEDYTIVLKEVFNIVVLETAEGNRFAACMRDDTIEMTVPGFDKWFSVNMKTGDIESFNRLSASEAVFGFAGWLTSREEKAVMSSTDDAAPIADLVQQFINENKLSDPRNGWDNNLIHPSGECSGPTK